ncbi:MFS transporter [Deinococcus ruber]|nr:MFS transporter [Deinococcus ruber]
MTEPSSSASAVKRPPLLFLMVAAFLFSMGFALVFPVLPFIVAQYVPQTGQQAAMIGFLGAAYALCSFFGSPVLGALSDAYGRRPVLMLTLAGSAIGYVIFGIGGSLFMLFLGRIIDGLCAGGMSAMFGYVADTTPEEERGKVFGQIGAVIGAGFIIGPAIGGWLSRYGLSVPMFAAAAVCTLNLLWGLLILPESLPPERRQKHFDASHLNPLTQLSGALAYPVVRRLIVVSMLFILPFSLMQIALSLLARDTLHWGPAQVSSTFIAVGVCDIIAQGVLLPFLLKWLGERGVALLGLSFGVIGMACMALLPIFPVSLLLYFSVVLFATGEGIFNASLSAILSNAAPPEAQGRVQGGAGAFSSLAQVVGPLGGGQLYARLSATPTFGIGAGLILAALGLLGFQGPMPAAKTQPQT